MCTIRTLNADEIECRFQQVKETGCILLLYKDARCDMRILDETFTVEGWQREHTVINNNLFCTVSIWDEKKQIWIKKQDVGVESMAEKEKGEASDSFKRACFNIGIGRELYSAPFIWVPLSSSEVSKSDKGGYRLDFKVKFHVSEISYNEKREINHLVIVDQTGKKRFDMNHRVVPEAKKQELNDILDILESASKDLESCKILKDVISTWNKYPQLHSHDTFILKCSNRKAQLTAKK